MKLRLIKIGLLLAGNALGLWIASLILDDMSVSGLAFVMAVAIFTVVAVVAQPVITKLAERYAEALTGGAALIATAVSLVLTAAISDGLAIDGIGTWILATVIVWAAATVIGVVLVRAYAREAVLR